MIRIIIIIRPIAIARAIVRNIIARGARIAVVPIAVAPSDHRLLISRQRIAATLIRRIAMLILFMIMSGGGGGRIVRESMNLAMFIVGIGLDILIY
jgi:hypothetical protein